MSGLVALALYAVGYCYTLARMVRHEFRPGESPWDAVEYMAVLMVCCVFWPVLMLAVLARAIVEREAR